VHLRRVRACARLLRRTGRIEGFDVPSAARVVQRLSKAHERSRFDCGVDALTRYLRQQARQDAEKHVAAPFVLVEPPRLEVLGYYTLSASVLTVDQVAAGLARKLPRYPQLPVTLIGRLAVDVRMRGQGCGEHLLIDALHRSLSHADQIAAMAVVVDAKDAAAAAFYGHFGFLPLQESARRWYLPMTTVEQLLG
jgi:GNAT superfamily N-acetyltransferase